MLLRVAKSGSTGNAYALETENEILLIEAGIPVPNIKRMINFQIDKVAGLCVSHEHT